MAALSTGVATVSTLASTSMSSRYREAEATYVQRREADQERKRQKQLATHDAYRATNRLRMAVRRAP